MAKEIEASMTFKKEERSYYSEKGWRLATYEEAKNGVESIKEQGLLNKWERARLLDGWISCSGDNLQIGNTFRSCMGYMLLIQTQPTSGSAYADVNLSDLGKEVALFLCADDWNYEVVYWLLNSWSKSETMDLKDVRDGNIPSTDAARLREANETLGKISRKLSKEVGVACEKAGKSKYNGRNSVKDVLSAMIKSLEDDEDIGQICNVSRMLRSIFPDSVEPAWLEDDAWNAIAEAFWSYFTNSFAGYVVQEYAEMIETFLEGGYYLPDTTTPSQRKFAIATKTLFYISKYRSEIIHAPLLHECGMSCSEKNFCYEADRAAGDGEHLKRMLQDNPMWRPYANTGNYDLLHMILLVIAKERTIYSDFRYVVKMLFDCGAQARAVYAIESCRNETVLHGIGTKLGDQNMSLEFAYWVLEHCDEKGRQELVTAIDENGMTALHRASEKGNQNICQVLLDKGAALDAKDDKGMTPVHYAAMIEEKYIQDTFDIFVKRPNFSDCVDLKDDDGVGAIDTILANSGQAELVAKILPFSTQPQDYYKKVNWDDILPLLLVKGDVDLVADVFQNGPKLPYMYSEGKTALHFAAMCEDEMYALEMVQAILRHSQVEEKQKFVAERDIGGRTALHEAALAGNLDVCEALLEANPKILHIKDRDGRQPLFEAVKAIRDEAFQYLVKLYFTPSMVTDDFIDRKGQTPLHIAASMGKAKIVEELAKQEPSLRSVIKRPDFLGKTALHMAAKYGDLKTVDILLRHGAEPLKERDCDRRTALHYAVQATTGEDMVGILLKGCKSDEEKLLLLFASAAGFGTADQMSSDPLRSHLLNLKEQIKGRVGTDNLLQTAACLGDIEMVKELLARGCQLEDIRNPDWKNNLQSPKKERVEKVLTKLDRIVDQGNDQPTAFDNLGRDEYARGLAALFLNPYLKSPITVGISGSWGMGKSSLMMRTEGILLKTAAQLALLPSSEFLNSASGSTMDLPGAKTFKLSEKGKIKQNQIRRQLDLLNNERVQMENLNEDSLVMFLNNYDLKHRDIFKSLAVMDSSDTFEQNGQSPLKLEGDSETEGSVPAILTVQYNAWKYKNETEALAGMAVEITKEIEGTMTQAQWMSTCWRNTWNKKKYAIFVEIIFPCLLTIALAFSITLIVWVMLDRFKLKQWANAKYACLPAAIVMTGWTLTYSVMGILKPVSSQLMNYVSFPDHADKLGYQDRVISDIKFLKGEIGKKPNAAFIRFLMLWQWITSFFFGLSVLWGWIISIFLVLPILCRLITSFFLASPNTRLEIMSFFFNPTRPRKAIEIAKVAPEIAKIATASTARLRIIVFVEDLDRCQETVILQVLSAINLVLAVCEIDVILGMDKELVERAIIKQFGQTEGSTSSERNQELAEKYLQKIIQLPLDLADPSEEESLIFLKGQLGVFENDDEKDDSTLHEDEVDEDSRSSKERSFEIEREAEKKINIPQQVAINMEKNGKDKGKKCYISLIPIRDMLFASYSKGEEDAFCYFHKLATECRKIPREWKRLLSYHRLVWNIFLMINKSKVFAGWQVQLITWIFMCWEWKENMNFIIERWDNIDFRKASDSNYPSLLSVVESLIEEHKKNNTSHEGDARERKGIVVKITNIDEPGSGSTNEEKLEDDARKKAVPQGDTARSTDGSKIRKMNSPDKFENDMKDNMFAELLEKIEELNKDIKELKGKNEKRVKEDKITLPNLQNWERMKLALERYDVRMDGIQAFQRFRFYCIAGYLPQGLSRA